MRFEHRRQPLLSITAFMRRQLKFLVMSLLIVGLSLGVGTLGYMYFAGFNGVDAFLNASMILSGMGPVNDMPDDAAKYFASIYALYSGVALLTTVAVMLAPMVHRILHALHLEDPGS